MALFCTELIQNHSTLTTQFLYSWLVVDEAYVTKSTLRSQGIGPCTVSWHEEQCYGIVMHVLQPVSLL